MIELILTLLGLFSSGVQNPSPTPQRPGGPKPSPDLPPDA